MEFRREASIAGDSIIIRDYTAPAKRAPGEKRKPKQNPTRDDVWKINMINAIRKLTKILNHYFHGGDLHIKLTYKDKPTDEQAKKDKEKFLRQLRNYHKKTGTDFYWVAVTEKVNKQGEPARIHHHIVCSETDMSVIRELWNHGLVFGGELYDHRNYHKLAEYLIKETSKTYREANSVFRRRYTTSRNIKEPETRQVSVSPSELFEDPKVPKGYYIDGDVNEYEHKLCGVTCREYILMPLPGAKKRKRLTGKIIKDTENYTRAMRDAYDEEQESLFSSILR